MILANLRGFIICFEIMYISLLLKKIKEFSGRAKVIASPLKGSGRTKGGMRGPE